MSSTKIPKYCQHKGRGYAYLCYKGQEYYLGPYGSEESRTRYRQFLDQILSGREVYRPGKFALVVELADRYLAYARGYYSPEATVMWEVERVITDLVAEYGTLESQDFRPVFLITLKEKWIKRKLSRGTVNKYMARVKRIFRWGVVYELVTPAVTQALDCVESEKAGYSRAAESEPVKPVDVATVESTLPYLPPHLADVARLQLLTGARPSEILRLTPGMVDVSGPLWVARLERHKTRHKRKERALVFGPQAQSILRPYLVRGADEACFRPIDGKLWWAQQSGRKLNLERHRCNKFYDANTYELAVERAVKRAQKAGLEVMKWTPYQLRHTRGTELEKRYGIQGAQVVLGHDDPKTTRIYSEINLERAKQIMAEVG